MLRRSIAAALLLIMVAWTEVSYSPMLILHAWHARGMSVKVEHIAHHQHAMPASHSCCPKIGRPEAAALNVLAATTLPCQNQHRCCVIQGNSNPPSPASARQDTTPQLAVAAAIEVDPLQRISFLASGITAARRGSPDPLGMVLRI